MSAEPTMPQLSNRYLLREHSVRASAGPDLVRVCRAYWVRGGHMHPVHGAEASDPDALRRLMRSAYPDAVEVAEVGQSAAAEPRPRPSRLPLGSAEGGPVVLTGRQMNRNISEALSMAAHGRPVTVTMLDEPYAVIISYPEYLRLTGMDASAAEERHSRTVAHIDERRALARGGIAR